MPEEKESYSVSNEKSDQLKRASAYVPVKWKEALQKIQEETGLSESAQVKIAIEMYLRSKGRI